MRVVAGAAGRDAILRATFERGPEAAILDFTVTVSVELGSVHAVAKAPAAYIATLW